MQYFRDLQRREVEEAGSKQHVGKNQERGFDYKQWNYILYIPKRELSSSNFGLYGEGNSIDVLHERLRSRGYAGQWHKQVMSNLQGDLTQATK